MSDFQTYLAKADELKENKDFERAVEQYLKALDFKPADYEVMEKIADAYFCLSNFEKAKIELLKAENVNFNNTNVHYFLVLIYFAEEKFEKAILEFKYVVTL